MFSWVDGGYRITSACTAGFVTLTLVSCASPVRSEREGVLTGKIFFAGGPAPGPRPLPGWIHIASVNGSAATLVRVRGRFHVALRAGDYRVYASFMKRGDSFGCRATQVRLQPGVSANVSLGVGCLMD